MPLKREKVVFAGGCFWCTEAIFQRLRGVETVTSGYVGGSMENPSYHDVITGKTGHAEAIQIEFDPSVIPFRDLLDVFFQTHDPTSLNRQGADVGTQYRSGVFYTSDNQKKIVDEYIRTATDTNEFKGQIVTEVKPLEKFFEAENYHKNYYEKNSYEPYCQVVISPKLNQLREKYAPLLKKS